MNERSDPMDSLKRGLYEPVNRLPKLRRTRLNLEKTGVPVDWSAAKRPGANLFTVRILKRILFVAVGFFALAVAVALFIFYRGGGTVSGGQLELAIEGPTSVRAGETATFQIKITNNNTAPLESVDLIVEYPTGTIAPDSDGVALTRERIPLGDIGAGDDETRAVKAILFGVRGVELEVIAALEYRLRGSNAIFDKQASAQVKVESTPVTLVVDVPEEINTGQDLIINVEAVSNSETPLTNTVILAHYPPGFEFTRAVPAATEENNLWKISNWRAGEKKSIQIFGKLNGQDEEEKVFRVEAGMIGEEESELAVVYGGETKTTVLSRPYVALSAAINGSSLAEYPASSKEMLRLDIDWQNNLPTEITDAEILVTVAGNALDRATISPDGGFYQSLNNSVLFSGQSKSELRSIPPGSTGRARMTFSTLALNAPEQAALRNPTIDLKIQFRGRRTTEDAERVVVDSEVSKKIKVSSVLQLAAKPLHRGGTLENSGTLPPKVGDETTYTIVWSVINSTNDVRDTTVKTTLPSYIKWLDVQLPTNEPLTFVPNDSGGGEVTWNLETVRAGTGTATPAREVSFQIGLTPSLSQVNTAPELTSAPSITGTDVFTRQTLSRTLQRVLDTYLTADPGFQFGEDKVVNPV